VYDLQAVEMLFKLGLARSYVPFPDRTLPSVKRGLEVLTAAETVSGAVDVPEPCWCSGGHVPADDGGRLMMWCPGS
jgi:hypothetical protein